MGIEVPIATHGVFPALEDSPEPYDAPSVGDAFAKVTSQDADARMELDRYLVAKYGEVVDLEEAAHKHRIPTAGPLSWRSSSR